MEVERLRTLPNESSKSDDARPIPTEAELSGQKTKNIKMKQYLCVKHALPKTRLTHTILHENVSQDRHLEMTLSNIRHTRNKSSNIHDLTRRAFEAQQSRKMKKWKKEDENRIAGMNLPQINHLEMESAPVTVVIYRMPEHAERTWSGGKRQQQLPMMKVRRERTEIVTYQDKAFLTKLPPVVEIDQRKLEKHNTYCGKVLMAKGMPGQDQRFKELASTLSPAMLNDRDKYPVQNMVMKSRRAKYANIFPLNSDPGFRRSPDVKVIVASRPRSVVSSKLSDKSFGKGPRMFSCTTKKRKKKSGKAAKSVRIEETQAFPDSSGQSVFSGETTLGDYHEEGNSGESISS